MRTSLLTILALLSVILTGCFLSSPYNVIEYGPFLAQEYSVSPGLGENGGKVWCELSIDGKVFEMPDDWERIEFCNEVPNLEYPFIMIQVQEVNGGFFPKNYLISNLNQEIAIHKIPDGLDYRYYWSSDGKYLIIPTETGDILYDPFTGQETLTSFQGSFLDLSPDGKSILSMMENGDPFEIQVTNIETGALQAYTIDSKTFPWLKDYSHEPFSYLWIAAHFSWKQTENGYELVMP